MAKRIREPITVKATCLVNGEWVDVDTLTPEQKKQLATALKCEYLNGLFRGEAEFFPAEKAGGAEEHRDRAAEWQKVRGGTHGSRPTEG